MPALNYEFVYFASGPHTRQPRTVNATGGFIPIGVPPGQETLLLGSMFQLQTGLLSATQTVGGKIYTFAFVNVSGGNPPGVTSFDIHTSPPPVTVGTAPVTVLVVYVPPGGPGGPGSATGATIDAFDESLGRLVDDTFVTVAPDGSETGSGNVDGYVDTTARAETVAALAVITPTGADFDKWVNLNDPQQPSGVTVAGVTTSGADLTVAHGTNVSALAFYKTPPPPPPPDPCRTILQRLCTELRLEPGIPVINTPGWKASLLHCLQQHEITQAEYNAAIQAIDHPLPHGQLHPGLPC